MLALEAIRLDGGIQVRVLIDQSAVDEYAEQFVLGAELPAVDVFFDGRERWLADGFHRVTAARQAGLVTIAAHVHEGTRDDAILYAVGANARHGVRMTPQDKRRAVLLVLAKDEWARWSDREIGRRCNVNHHLVADIRRGNAPPADTVLNERAGTTYERKVKRVPVMGPAVKARRRALAGVRACANLLRVQGEADAEAWANLVGAVEAMVRIGATGDGK